MWVLDRGDDDSPLTLIRYLAERHEVTLLTEQSYLNPHPKELMLLNHV